MPLPARCPLTGEPAVRHIGRLSRQFAETLWRLSHGVRIGRLVSDTPHFDLWESPTGLAFFDPPLAGDDRFYTALYENDPDLRRQLREAGHYRGDLRAAAAKIAPGAKILDVGCGRGAFREFVPHADYRGLEPHHANEGKPDWIIKKSLDAHAATHAGAYDVVVAFHLIEHLVDPVSFVRLMTTLLRPGGMLILACPAWPTLLNEIPNYALNMPPHHLTWWTENALRVLCARTGLTDIETAAMFGNSGGDMLPWMHRFSFIKAREPYYRGSLLWYASLGIAYVLATLAVTLKRQRRTTRVTDVMVFARTPTT